MQWTDVTAPPSTQKLRQFAGLCLLVFGGLALWRASHGQMGVETSIMAGLGVGIGGLGLLRPAAVRFIYTGWMIAAFPIGWTISKVVLGVLFVIVFTPIAIVFRLIGRDALRLRRGSGQSYWTTKPQASVESFFRQS
jgi:hypothetical protein